VNPFASRHRTDNIMKTFLRVFFIALFVLQISPAYPLGERTPANMPDAPVGHPHSPLSQTAMSMLETNGFVVVPGKALHNMIETYHALRAENTPIFVTTDSILHSAHRVFAQVLELMETKHLSDDLRRLTRFMLQQSLQDAASAEHAQVLEALRANVAFFSVAARLLRLHDAVPAEMEHLVEQETRLIEAHQGFAKSPALGYLEDYSQYVPRGRYTQSEELGAYFMAMMWYGRPGFYAVPNSSLGISPALARRLTRQALLMVRALDRAGEAAQPALRAWERIDQVAGFFVGASDDLDIYDFKKAALQVYGGLPDDADLADESRLDIFLSEIQKVRPPKILSTLQFDASDANAQAPQIPLGFRFLGQRALPDAWILQNLVYPRVMDYTGQSQPFSLVMSQRGPIRGMPRGLDVMAVLGSDLAVGIIRDEGDADYELYDEQLAKLQRMFADRHDQWTQGLSGQWLFNLKLLLTGPQGGMPAFMGSEAWTGKMLNTALGSWTELRHDTILYAKQSYSEKGTGLPRPVDLTRGGVEPFPELFARVRDLARALRTDDCIRGLIPPESTKKLREFEDLLEVLADMAAKELAREPLSEEEFKTIWNIGGLLERATTLPPHEAKRTGTLVDNDMAVVADVHTDPNSGQVLQVGVGRPSIMYVSMVRHGRERIAAGPVYSYYEFKQPMAQRLTNEQWRMMLQKGLAPALPEWTSGFAVQ